MHVAPLAGNTLGSPDDDFVLVQWTAEVGDHWIAPLHVHYRDDEAWYVLSGTLGFRLGDDELLANAGVCCAGSARNAAHVLERRQDGSGVPLGNASENRAADRRDPYC